ncbi:head-tail connector protein [Clostridium botulinum]|uniref:head-tail connector protein n=1 Tax=Clostridium botulinum TaxID=1491 RepID=UPI000773A5A6|nr:head-tail connector protein [Clostridium botulinum]NFN09408.1 phage gp6-like head-tail connector protein [Clostridium botulinum]NFN32912.1 phage gp6-like head-tail connector protein [Clostridium botulinum]
MDLQQVKQFLRIDFDDDDSYIILLIDVAKEYIIDAVGKYDETSARYKLLLLNIVSTLYENREYTIDKTNEKVAYTLKSIILQLQLEGDSIE